MKGNFLCTKSASFVQKLQRHFCLTYSQDMFPMILDTSNLCRPLPVIIHNFCPYY